MKKWKTTLVGCLAAGVVALQPLVATGEIDVKALVYAFFIAAFSAVAKDFNVTGGK